MPAPMPPYPPHPQGIMSTDGTAMMYQCTSRIVPRLFFFVFKDFVSACTTAPAVARHRSNG